MTRRCDVCGQAEGSVTDDQPIPLGPLEQCELCQRWACPDCLCEADCCFADADEFAEDPTWAPPGWRKRPRVADYEEWERLV